MRLGFYKLTSTLCKLNLDKGLKGQRGGYEFERSSANLIKI